MLLRLGPFATYFIGARPHVGGLGIKISIDFKIDAARHCHTEEEIGTDSKEHGVKGTSTMRVNAAIETTKVKEIV